MNKYIVWGIVIAAAWFLWHRSGYKMPAFLGGK
jgi:hypothetical protein